MNICKQMFQGDIMIERIGGRGKKQQQQQQKKKKKTE